MMSKGKLDCVLVGYNQSPVIPKGPRSIRVKTHQLKNNAAFMPIRMAYLVFLTQKRGPREKFLEDGNLCAFELLASVAGKLLEESESSTSSNMAEAKLKPCVYRDGDEGYRRNSDSRGSVSERFDRASSSAERSFVPETYAEKALCGTKLEICDVKNGNSSVCDVVNCSDKKQRGDLSMAEAYCIMDQKQECVNNPNIILNNIESGLKFPLYRNLLKNNVQLGIRDDDEKNCFGCDDKFSTNVRSEPKFIYKKIDKLRCSRLRVAAPKTRDRDLYNTSEGMNSFYRYMKKSYARERCNYHHATIKKRKLSNNKSAITDPKVRLKIKSLMVPELYINLAETDTVGSLKRAVMEEITALLGGGIRVGVVFEGRKCRGNDTTLQQAGISECIDLENLGFMIEPKLTHVDNQYTPRSPVIDSGISNVSGDPTPNANVEGSNSNNNHLVPSPQTPSNNVTPANAVSSSDTDSKALVPLITINPEALAIIPMNPKPIKRSSGISQRRTRRPFSVAEVEALVSAVEKLGTGRWRDVKMAAFESADHRTYVDLKDKWKTLVHTASISPQQRRGKPVPQELLERVLAAHSYWSQHQSKQHGKNSNDEPIWMDHL